MNLKPCAHCGQPFSLLNPGRVPKFCSSRCRVASHRSTKPEIGWAYGARVRAEKYGLEIEFSDFSKQQVLDRYGSTCYYCVDGDFEQLDHFIPIRAGGAHTLDNVRPSCMTCNMTKGNVDRVTIATFDNAS